jgi:hypothetical protein
VQTLMQCTGRLAINYRWTSWNWKKSVEMKNFRLITDLFSEKFSISSRKSRNNRIISMNSWLLMEGFWLVSSNFSLEIALMCMRQPCIFPAQPSTPITEAATSSHSQQRNRMQPRMQLLKYPYWENAVLGELHWKGDLKWSTLFQDSTLFFIHKNWCTLTSKEIPHYLSVYQGWKYELCMGWTRKVTKYLLSVGFWNF